MYEDLIKQICLDSADVFFDPSKTPEEKFAALLRIGDAILLAEMDHVDPVAAQRTLGRLFSDEPITLDGGQSLSWPISFQPGKVEEND